MLKIDKFLIVRIGEPAPEFAGRTLDGKELRLADLRGKAVLLDFWATWCGPCVAELPNVRKIHERYGGENGDLVIVACSLDSEDEKVGAFIKKKDINWAQIVAGPADNNPIAKKYFVEGIPATFLIDADGKIVAKDLRGAALQTEVDRLVGKMRQSKRKTQSSDAQVTK